MGGFAWVGFSLRGFVRDGFVISRVCLGLFIIERFCCEEGLSGMNLSFGGLIWVGLSLVGFVVGRVCRW